MKTVTLPIEEYNELLQDRQDKKRLLDMSEKDAKDKGYLVQMITNVWQEKDPYGWGEHWEYIREKNTLKIISGDGALDLAQKEIDRLAKLSEELSGRVEALKMENKRLKNRGFLSRLFNTDPGEPADETEQKE